MSWLFVPLGHILFLSSLFPWIVYSVNNVSWEVVESFLGITVHSVPRGSWLTGWRSEGNCNQASSTLMTSLVSCVQRSSCVTSLDLQEKKKKLFPLIFLHFLGVRISCKCWFLNLVLIIDRSGCWDLCDKSGWPLCYKLSILLSFYCHTGFPCLLRAHFVWINGSFMWLCIAQGSRERIVTFWGNEWVEWWLKCGEISKKMPDKRLPWATEFDLVGCIYEVKVQWTTLYFVFNSFHLMICFHLFGFYL